LKAVGSIPDGVVVRLMRMQTIVTEDFYESLSLCIEVVLRFENVKPYYSQIWQNAVLHLEKCQCLFRHFESELPVNALEFVAILMGAASQSETAVRILIDFTERFSEVRAFSLLFLPVRNPNLRLVAAFYEQLLDLPDILKFEEFYTCAEFLLSPNRLTAIFECDQVDFQLFQKSRVCFRMIQLLDDEEAQVDILRLMLAIESKFDVPVFRSESGKLFRLLDVDVMREPAFLLLAAMAKFGAEGIDTELLDRIAAEFEARPGEEAEADRENADETKENPEVEPGGTASEYEEEEEPTD